MVPYTGMRAAILTGSLLIPPLSGPAHAAPKPEVGNSTLVLEAGSGRVFHTGRPIANLFAANPKVAEARPASPNSVFVFGVGPGRTTVAAMDEQGAVLAQYDVVVRPSSFGAGEATRASRRALPGVETAFAPTPDGMVATGQLLNGRQADAVETAAGPYAGRSGTLYDRTTVTGPEQVTLKVRVAEINRSITRQLGINWSLASTIGRFGIAGAITGGVSLATNLPNTLGLGYASKGVALDTLLDLLAQDRLITMLAEPNLTARSGEVASFLAGGEYPIPISQQNNTITVQFKQYGVSLAFVPTVLSEGRISLHVRPEVSELTDQGAVSVQVGSGLFGSSTLTIPALTVRRVDTTVELGSGQSFAIAGLLSRKTAGNARGLPYLGELPVLGPLFRSDLYQRDESELVIVVTPYLVRPVTDASTLHVPTDTFTPPGDVDRLLLLRQRARPAAAAPLRPAAIPAAVSTGGFVLPGDAP